MSGFQRRKRAHDLVVAGRVTALSGVGVAALTVPAFALTAGPCILGGAEASRFCGLPVVTLLGGTVLTTTGLGLMAGGSAGYLKAAREIGVHRSPAPALVVMGSGLALLTVGMALPGLGVDGGGGVAAAGALTIAGGVVVLDQIHVSARTGAYQRASLRPQLDLSRRTVGIAGRF